MLIYILWGFILPWLFGLLLVIKVPKIMVIFLPICVAIAFIINTWGFNYYWSLKIKNNELSLSAFPFNLGLYPILGCLYIISIYFKKLNIIIAIVFFTLITTLIEFWALCKGQVIYRNGWTIYYTAISYFFAYIIVLSYYKLILYFGLLDKQQ
ncbi:hypothetical protein [Bacillus sp. AFS017336]|uniref:hypothetical protein n=1 Tax=Bacillus sp. AFS017336 TaxID=2033489 RepID=UPI000BF1BB8D|nr:hypothetical protein [Bacillus sp. AFS017336]PEL12650.1 hypothetical protein CN601_06800 [Bacillus sp. AFS017336]